ncbi:MAG: glycosyltransferase family 2 protein [Clostridia bacterium]|nr:glycosyltransferase family 2 protein [Clostridia bacterium]
MGETLLRAVSIVCEVAATVLMLLYAYRALYVVIGLFTTRKFAPAKKYHRYGIVIAARNEEAVIGSLLDSIAAQEYPAELLKVFVVADNCDPDDRTAAIAREKGAVCYERQDTQHRTKGYALEFLFDCIARDYGVDACDGYFVFDADNLLAPDYIARMNDAVDAGEKIITSCRNTRNFGDNAISFSYGVHWFGTVRAEHRARSLLRLSTRLQGTGYYFTSELVKDGWHYTSLTEDRYLTADAVLRGYHISYNDAAMFFDEQPTTMSVVMRQRLRWAKGNLHAFADTGWRLFKGIFNGRGFVSYDIFMTVLPESLILLVKDILAFAASLGLLLLGNMTQQALQEFVFTLGLGAIGGYLGKVVYPLYIMFIERRRLPKFAFWKKITGSLLWFVFPLIGTVTMVFALFCRVEWKPIPHKSTARPDLEIEK